MREGLCAPVDNNKMDALTFKPKPLIALPLLIIFGLLIYANALSGSFQVDDEPTIVLNKAVQNLNFAEIWQKQPARFIAYASFALNYQISKLDPLGYHLINIVIHIANSFLVYLFAFYLLRLEEARSGQFKDKVRLLALGASLIFLAHPLQTQAVTYITQRITALCVFFYLASLLFYIGGVLKQNLVLKLASLLFFIFALFTKQISFTLPFILLLIEYCFLKTPLRFGKTLYKSVAPYFALLILFYFLIYHGAVTGGTLESVTKANTDMSRLQYFASEFNVLKTYLGLVLFPVGLNFAHQFYATVNFFELDTIVPFLFLAGLLLTGFKCYRTHPYYAFGILWFFIALSVESTFFPIRDLGAEHRMYLPMVGLSILLTLVLNHFFTGRRFFTVALIAYVGILGLLTHSRNEVWQTGVTLWQDATQKSPRNSTAFANLGIAYGKAGNNWKALQALQTAVRIDPTNDNAYAFLGRAYLNLGERENAVSALNIALAINPKNKVARYNLERLKASQA